VIPPAVPAGDDRPDQLAVVLGEYHRLRIAAEQRGHRPSGIGRSAAVLGRVLPERHEIARILRRSSPQDEIHPPILPCGQE
jgi:hypothetical protein